MWLDGDKAMTQDAPPTPTESPPEAEFVARVRDDDSRGINGDITEPIYGSLYLPRKFKVRLCTSRTSRAHVSCVCLSVSLTVSPIIHGIRD